MEINTDPQKIADLLTRGVDEVIQLDELRAKLLSGKKLRVKLGIDPTSPSLHLGRSVPLLKLRDFQELGHQVVLIVGDFTGVIGDTSDKDSERPMLSKDTIQENMLSYALQASKILDLSDNKAEVHYNSKWLEKMTYEDIGKQADLFSVADFIARDNIKRRLDAGKRVSLREVLYPLMQGYDSVAIKADIELGGTDQRFNLLAGRHMQPHFGQIPQNIIMVPLIKGLDGRKMSSSWGNTINFSDTPADMYGKVMSMSDDLMVDYFTFFTRVPMDKVKAYSDDLQNGRNPIEIKQILALQIVSMYHDSKLATEAEVSWKQTFSDQGLPPDLPQIKIAPGTSLSEVLLTSQLVSSKTEFKRLLSEGAIRYFNDAHWLNIETDLVINDNITVKVGKKRFLEIII